MKPRPQLLLLCLLMQVTLIAQVQWYQSQDGHNAPPYGTYGSSVRSLTPNSFVACYQWTMNNEEYTWKISKSHINGTEQKKFFVSGTWSAAEIKVAHNSVYVLLRSFPMGENAQFTFYKLDTNLVVKAQRQISFPNGFAIFNLNAFELDGSDNIYAAGDGQYPNGDEFSPASFLLKMDKNLQVKWSRMEQIETSFTNLLIDRDGRILVVEDHYSFFPLVKIRKYNSSGILLNTLSVQTDAARFNLLSKLDPSGNIFLYGGKSLGDTAQAMFIYKLSKTNGRLLYNRSYFSAASFQLCDMVIDEGGNIFSLASQYMSNGQQQCTMSRINNSNGNISWTHAYPFVTDSCSLVKLVMTGSDRFYAIGEKRANSFLSKGYVMQMKKNGVEEDVLNGPDSVSYQRSHTLVDGYTDRNDKLITIGNTNDFDPYTYNSNYFRAFAISFGQARGHHNCDTWGKGESEAAITEAPSTEAKTEEVLEVTRFVVYPNPVQDKLTITQSGTELYDKLYVYNMQGAVIIQKAINGTSIKVDAAELIDGVYLLVLRSSVSNKEKSVKFMVHK